MTSDITSTSHCLVPFDPTPVSTGEVDSEKANRITSSLNQKLPSKGISGHFGKVKEDLPLQGGADLAIALRFAQHAFKHSKNGIDQTALVEYVKQQNGIMKRKKAAKARKQIRTQQMIINAYQADRVAQEKIRAAAAFYDLNAANHSAQQEPGIYLLRLNREHTAVYIKDPTCSLYFDSQRGLYELVNQTLSSMLEPDYQTYRLDQFPSDHSPKKRKPTSFTTQTAKLEGYLRIPNGAHSIVCIFPGSGSRIDQPSNQRMVSMLTQDNFGTLLLDLLPEEEKALEFAKDNLPRLAADPNYLRTLVDRVKDITCQIAEKKPGLSICYLGASTGAAIALLAAAEMKDNVEAVVSRGGRPDILPKNLLRRLPIPTLFIAGAEDPPVLEASQSAHALMQETSRQVHLAVIEGATHGFTQTGALEQAMKLASGHFLEAFKSSSKPTPVALKKTTYQQLYADQLLTDFSHGPVTKGTVNRKKALKKIESLNRKLQKQRGAISFDPTQVEDTLEGGACSVIGLEFAKKAIHCFDKSTFIEDMTQFVAEHNQQVAGQLDLQTRIRTQQMVFNTFVVDQNRENTNFNQEKIRALSIPYGLDVAFSSEKIFVDTNLSQETLDQQMSHLEPGVYLLRLIQDANNDKLEVKGHTTIYVKGPHRSLYFDVNFGLYDMNTESGTRLIFDLLVSTKNYFGLDYYQFHKLKPAKTKAFFSA